MKKIIISPYSRKLRNKEGNNPKNYPYWSEVVKKLKENNVYIAQIGVKGEDRIELVDEFLVNLSLKQLEQLVLEYDIWISIDNFFHHLGYLLEKQGIVIFGQSDPLIFGHKININLLKDRKYLRKDQFGMWESVEYIKECFVESSEVVERILNQLEK